MCFTYKLKRNNHFNILTVTINNLSLQKQNFIYTDLSLFLQATSSNFKGKNDKKPLPVYCLLISNKLCYYLQVKKII